jgi:hypothetical protein
LRPSPRDEITKNIDTVLASKNEEAERPTDQVYVLSGRCLGRRKVTFTSDNLFSATSVLLLKFVSNRKSFINLMTHIDRPAVRCPFS